MNIFIKTYIVLLFEKIKYLKINHGVFFLNTLLIIDIFVNEYLLKMSKKIYL